jgi:hypothetical protein
MFGGRGLLPVGVKYSEKWGEVYVGRKKLTNSIPIINLSICTLDMQKDRRRRADLDAYCPITMQEKIASVPRVPRLLKRICRCGTI